jgi:hypothetical protein
MAVAFRPVTIDLTVGRPGHTCRRWDVGLKRVNGSVFIEPDPWR